MPWMTSFTRSNSSGFQPPLLLLLWSRSGLFELLFFLWVLPWWLRSGSTQQWLMYERVRSGPDP